MTHIAIQGEPLNQTLENSLGELGSFIREGAKHWTTAKESNAKPQSVTASSSIGTDNDELTLVEALRRGEETAFETLVNRYYSQLLRMARTFVPTQAVAEEVVQETWMMVLEGINGFEGRSSLKTWIFHILSNRAKTRGIQERRYVSFTDLKKENDEDRDYTLGPENFHQSGPLRDHWAVAPISWDEMTPERRLLSKETGLQIERAISTLPQIQQRVIILRDVEGWKARDACDLLNFTESNQRVLLHRGRSKVRKILDAYLKEAPTTSPPRIPSIGTKAS